MATLIGAGAHATDIAHTHQFDICYPHHKDYPHPEKPDPVIVIGINDPWLRANIAMILNIRDNPWAHPTAYIGPECMIGHGTHINYAVHMTRTQLGRHCTIGPAVTICGDVHIGDRVLIGAGATICDRVTIEDDVTIGAGTVILPLTIIPAGTTWVGVPGKQIR